MDDQQNSENMPKIQINTGDEMSRGRYSNSMVVSHGADEFMLDWFLNSPNGAHLVSRIIVSPSHLKRIIGTLKENLDNYEKQFGGIGEIKIDDQAVH